MNETSALQTPSLESLVAELADEFLQRLEGGEQPQIEDYAGRYPQHAGVIRQVLAALELVRLSSSGSAASAEGPIAGAPQASGCLGDFRIVRQIGRGGMGVVYEAEQLSLSRRVALKVLPFAAVMDARQLARFKNEAQAAALLQHTDIVPVYFVGQDRGVHFYAMQYIEGQTLAEVIEGLRAEHLAPGESPGADGGELSRQRAAGSRQHSRQQIAGSRQKGEATGYGLQATEEAEGGERRVEGGEQLAPRDSRGGESERPLAPVVIAQSEKQLAPGESPGANYADTSPVALLSTQRSTNKREYFRTIANLGIQAAEALDHAHKHGILHRDIKPANLMLDTTRNVWVMDFGLARFSDPLPPGGEGHNGGLGSPPSPLRSPLTMTGDLVGTLRYMSPEQALAKRVIVDHRTDIYSLGVTLYELLTLQPAFPGRDRQEVLKQIAFDEPRAPRRIHGSIPAELETIVLKAMAKNPAERYATAQEIADDLNRYVLDVPIQARRPNVVQRVKKWSRRHKAVLRAAALATIIALTMASAIVWRQRNVAQTNYLRAEAERASAERTLGMASDAVAAMHRQLATSWVLYDELDQPGNEELLKNTAQFYESLSQQFIGGDPKSRYKRAWAYLQLADIRDVIKDHVGREQILASAIAILEGLVREYPGNPRYIQMLGSAYWRHTYVLADQVPRYQRACELFQDLVARFPSNGPEGGRESAAHYHGNAIWNWECGCFGHYKYSLAVVSGHLAQTLRRRGEFEKAEHGLRRAVDLMIEWDGDFPGHSHPPSTGVWRRGLGLLLRARGRPQEATRQLERALAELQDFVRKRPESVHGHSWLALTYLSVGRLEEAVQHAAIADDLSSYQWGHRISHLRSFLLNVDVPELGGRAIGRLRQAVELNPYKTSNWDRLAEAAVATADWELAVQAARKAVELSVGNADNHFSAAIAAAATGNAKEAEKSLGKALARLDDEVWVPNNLSWRLVRYPLREPGQGVLGLVLARKAVELAPDTGDVWNTLGVAHYRSGDFEAALVSLRKSLTLHGDSRPDASKDWLSWLGPRGSLPVRGDKQFGRAAFFLAMDHWQLGKAEGPAADNDTGQRQSRGTRSPAGPTEAGAGNHELEARHWYQEAVDWMEKNAPNDEELGRFRAEAEALMGLDETPVPEFEAEGSSGQPGAGSGQQAEGR